MATTSNPRPAALEQQLDNALSRLKRLEQHSIHKPTFKDKIIPGEGSITSFFLVYESVMKGETDQQKFKYIITCLSRVAQEIMVITMATLSTWEEVNQALTDEFGSTQHLQRKKQACMSLRLKKELITSFVEKFYSEAHPLLLANMLPLDDAIATDLDGLPAHLTLAMHISAVKRNFQDVQDIKEAQLALVDFYEFDLTQRALK